MAEFDSVIPAGKSGTLTAKIRTKTTQNGQISKSIAVTTNAVGAERLMLNVRFTSVSSVSVLPSQQMNINGVKGERPTSTLIFRRVDGKKLEITGVESTEDRFAITAKPVTKTQEVGHLQAVPGDVLVIATLAPNVEPVTTAGKIKVKTNHPDAPLVDIGYSLRIRPVIEANPPQVRLLLQDGNSAGRMTLFRIQNNLRGQYKLTGVQSSNPEIFKAELVDGDFKQQVHSVAVMLQDDVLPGSLEGPLIETLVVFTDDKAQPEVSIPVRIEPRALRKPAQPRPLE